MSNLVHSGGGRLVHNVTNGHLVHYFEPAPSACPYNPGNPEPSLSVSWTGNYTNEFAAGFDARYPSKSVVLSSVIDRCHWISWFARVYYLGGVWPYFDWGMSVELDATGAQPKWVFMWWHDPATAFPFPLITAEKTSGGTPAGSYVITERRTDSSDGTTITSDIDNINIQIVV